MHSIKTSNLLNNYQIIILIVISFPFLPPIFRTDTQPFFSIVIAVFFVILILFQIPPKKTLILYKFNIAITLLLIANLLLSALLNNSFSSIRSIQRLFTFTQFIIAFFIGSSIIINKNNKILYNIAWIYTIFTIVYFLTGGIIEKNILTRTSDFVMLNRSGRGASTLSPEPSFFALSMWNIFIINTLIIKDKYNKKKEYWFIGLVLLCILSTLGGYSVIFFIVITILYLFDIVRKRKILLLTLSSALLYAVYGFSSRAIKLISAITENGIISSTGDASIASRMRSFNIYLQNFKENIFIGTGFDFYGGGGFISIFSGMGILTTSIIIFIVIRFLLLKNSWRLKIIILIWFTILLISGPMGLPAIGFIIGLLTRKNI